MDIKVDYYKDQVPLTEMVDEKALRFQGDGVFDEFTD